MRLKHIEEWSKGRFKPVAMLAHVAAIAPSSCVELLSSSREKWFNGTKGATIGKAAWLACYRSCQRISEVMMAFALKPGRPANPFEFRNEKTIRSPRRIDQVIEAIRSGKPRGEDIEYASAYSERVFDRYYKLHMKRLEISLFDEQEFPNNFVEWLSVPEFVFLFSVTLPCWLEHKVCPSVLMNAACGGDVDSIAAILKLDPSAQFDGELSDRLFAISRSNPARYRQLLADASESPGINTDSEKMKYAISGMLLQTSKDIEWVRRGEMSVKILEYLCPDLSKKLVAEIKREFRNRGKKLDWGKSRLRPIDIRRLFDAIHRDKTNGKELIDPDFGCVQPASVTKRIDRAAELWPKMRERDIIAPN
ncbi:MAG: hypothetical protein NXI22_02210 [bacterium]|nr:hypothetical protein [bacterium]